MLGDSDDRAGGVIIGILITFGSVVIATAAAMLERILQNCRGYKIRERLNSVNEKTDGEARKMRAAEQSRSSGRGQREAAPLSFIR